MNYAKCVTCGWKVSRSRIDHLQTQAESHILDHPMCKAVALTDGEAESLVMQYGVKASQL